MSERERAVAELIKREATSLREARTVIGPRNSLNKFWTKEGTVQVLSIDYCSQYEDFSEEDGEEASDSELQLLLKDL